MSKNIALVSCVAKKLDYPAKAKDLYISPFFKKARRYAELNSDIWFILSAEHGLLDIDKEIEPYNTTLNNMKNNEVKIWAARVFKQLESRIQPGDRIIFLAGQNYRQHLINKIKNAGCKIEIPMEGLKIGEQMHWLDTQTGV